MSDTAASAPLTRRELEAKIARRAWQDEAFRAEFLTDPAATFVKYTNVAAEQLPRIVVHEEQPGSWHIVLPAKPAGTAELSDDELEKIAGGTDVVLTVFMSVVATVYTAIVGTVAHAASEANDCW